MLIFSAANSCIELGFLSGGKAMAVLRSVFVGDGLLLPQCADLYLARGHKLSLVATGNPHILAWAEQREVRTCKPDRLEGEFTGLSFEWLFSIANLQKLSSTILETPLAGAVNFHDALLPDQIGLNAPAWAIIEGREHHGISWHAMTSEVDAGPIYLQKSFGIEPDETAFTLNSKCFELGLTSFEELLDAIEADRCTPWEQRSLRGSVYRRQDRPKAAGTLDFNRSATELDQLVRGLNFGETYPNPLVLPKVRHAGTIYYVKTCAVLGSSAASKPGLVLSVEGDQVTVAAQDKCLQMTLSPAPSLSRKTTASILPGDVISGEDINADELTAAVAKVAQYEPEFRRRLEDLTDVELDFVRGAQQEEGQDWRRRPLPYLSRMQHSQQIAVICSYLARRSQQSCFDVAYSSRTISDLGTKYPGYFSEWVPLRFEWSPTTRPQEAVGAVEAQLQCLARSLTYLSDLSARFRTPDSTSLTCAIIDREQSAASATASGCAVLFEICGPACFIVFDASRVDEHQVDALIERLAVFSAAFLQLDTSLAHLPMISPEEQDRILYHWNDSQKVVETSVCVHQLIENQVQRTPDADAVCCGRTSLTYRELNERAGELAQALLARGVRVGDIVGLFLPRSVNMVVAVLAVWKAGAAYLPLDPDFPPDRVHFMIDDSQTRLILAEHGQRAIPATTRAEILYIDDYDAPSLDAVGLPHVDSDDLAYVIYTSGSTGLPKGVMVEHRNVVNFFSGMDDRVPVYEDRQNVWLAVTSLSFDISVLELFWTLSRGFKVVIHSPEVIVSKARARQNPALAGLSFGLFYWGNDASVGPEKYHLLLEGARFADTHGFDSIWTPERHFHAFGGPFPNPAVTGAAVAAVTRNLSIRAGSCVLPLHHPIRVAEEWAVVDNLSNGRIGLAFASGWMPEDFVLRPENTPPLNRTNLVTSIDTVRRLWRGEEVRFPLGEQEIGVTTQPRPISKELPVWLTTAGNPESYREAARMGAHVLTHLLGQSIAELAEKISLYRQELLKLGRDPGDYKVTLMLHTLIGADREAVRERARVPLKEYLKSAAALIKQYAWDFPAFKKPQGLAQPADIDLRSLSEDELDAILDFAFLRYFEDSGLFGTVPDALARLEEVRAAGVDEIGCLIDWGLPEMIALDGLKPLANVVHLCKSSGAPSHEDGFAKEILRHQVTHLQATPSMMRSFMMSSEDRAALGAIRHILIGGEALHGSLVRELQQLTAASIQNMYGPTETTIWSTSALANSFSGIVTIGRPIANTQVYVLDRFIQPVPPGSVGELFIGGQGVTRGYLHRKQLNDERFVKDPYSTGRLYRTGDLARFDENGSLHFVGRNDHQVKIRGYRIELGEIESRLATLSGVSEAVVTAQKSENGDTRLIAYVRGDIANLTETHLVDHLRAGLPDAMIPTDFMFLESFPLTPNAKVDRNRLPSPSKAAASAGLPYLPPDGALEEAISLAFAQTLGRQQVSRHDNFFALGGHSLLAVQLHRDLRSKVAPGITITDLFRFPTVAGLAAHLSGDDPSSRQLSKAADRAALRRRALQQRNPRTRADVLV
nr:luciferase [arsenite-oxidising bacterium NT-25]